MTRRAALVRPGALHRHRETALDAGAEVGVAIELARVAVLALELLEHVPGEVVVLEPRPCRPRLRVRVGRRLGELVARGERDAVERVAARDDGVRDRVAVDGRAVVVAADALGARALALQDEVRRLGQVDDVDGLARDGRGPRGPVGRRQAGLDQGGEGGVADRRRRGIGHVNVIRSAAHGGERAVLRDDGRPVVAGAHGVAELLELRGAGVVRPRDGDDDRVLEDRAPVRPQLAHRRRERRVGRARVAMIENRRHGRRGHRIGSLRSRVRRWRSRHDGRGFDRGRTAGDSETRGDRNQTEEGVVLHGRAHPSIELSVVCPVSRLERGTTTFPERKIRRTFVANSSNGGACLRRGQKFVRRSET